MLSMQAGPPTFKGHVHWFVLILVNKVSLNQIVLLIKQFILKHFLNRLFLNVYVIIFLRIFSFSSFNKELY